MKKFFSIPAEFIEDQRYKKLSISAKFLYAILSEKTELGTKEVDLSLEDIRCYLNCSLTTSGKIIRELEDWGLIKRTRKSYGSPYSIKIIK